MYWSELDEHATQCSFTVRASKSCETVNRFLAHPTSGSSDEAIGFLQKNSVSIASDHLFFSEGEMEDTVFHTGSIPSYCRAMNKTASHNQDGEGHQEALLHLTLEGLLPAKHELLLNPALRTASLFSSAADGSQRW